MLSVRRKLVAGAIGGTRMLCFTTCCSESSRQDPPIGTTSAALSGFPQ